MDGSEFHLGSYVWGSGDEANLDDPKTEMRSLGMTSAVHQVLFDFDGLLAHARSEVTVLVDAEADAE
jgi:hypothetical protein